MTHKKEVVFSLLFVIMVLCTGCSDKDNGDTSKNNRTSGESFVQEETIEEVPRGLRNVPPPPRLLN